MDGPGGWRQGIYEKNLRKSPKVQVAKKTELLPVHLTSHQESQYSIVGPLAREAPVL